MNSESPPILESEECEKLLHILLHYYTTPKKRVKAVRNHCMALLMLDAGLRVGELVSLRMSDLFFNSQPVRTIFIKPHMTKNKVEHSIPVSDRLSEALQSYFSEWFITDLVNGTAFAFYSGDEDQPISTRQVERIICDAGWKSLGRPVHPHVLRHTLATRLMRVTNINTVQQILGHKYLASTQVYCHPNQEDKRLAIESLAGTPAPVEPVEQASPEQTQPVEPERPGPQPASPSASPPASLW